MANYYATCRSNYFQVKDKDAFVAECNKRSISVWDDQKDGRVGIYDEDGGWPSSYHDEDVGDYVDYDITDFVAEHLADGAVAILMETGAEKLRYVAGHAVAVNSKGEYKTVNLNDIYEQAAGLTDKPDEITNCEY